MMGYALAAIGIGAMLGAWLRWWFGLLLNPVFPTIPFGTLTSNILGAFLIGLFMELTKGQTYISQELRLAFVTGFLGSLTTFSTFSAETVTLISNQEYLWAALIILAHVVGSIFATIFGIYTVKFITSQVGV